MITCTYSGDLSDKSNIQENILLIERELLKMDQADIKTEHIFIDGIYERKITIPPYTLLTGAEHKTDYKIRLEEGTICVNTDDGVMVLTAPCEIEAKSGSKRIGQVYGDKVVWVDIYENLDNEKDLSIIEKRLYVIPECGLGDTRIRKIESAKNDFKLFLSQINMSLEEVNSIVVIESDCVDMPIGFDVEVNKSRIEGYGLFALRDFKKGEVICPGRIDGNRTPAGRFINHSLENNAIPKMVGDDIFAVADKNIYVNDEILINYRDSMRINFNFEVSL